MKANEKKELQKLLEDHNLWSDFGKAACQVMKGHKGQYLDLVEPEFALSRVKHILCSNKKVAGRFNSTESAWLHHMVHNAEGRLGTLLKKYCKQNLIHIIDFLLKVDKWPIPSPETLGVSELAVYANMEEVIDKKSEELRFSQREPEPEKVEESKDALPFIFEDAVTEYTNCDPVSDLETARQYLDRASRFLFYSKGDESLARVLEAKQNLINTLQTKVQRLSMEVIELSKPKDNGEEVEPITITRKELASIKGVGSKALEELIPFLMDKGIDIQ